MGEVLSEEGGVGGGGDVAPQFFAILLLYGVVIVFVTGPAPITKGTDCSVVNKSCASWHLVASS